MSFPRKGGGVLRKYHNSFFGLYSTVRVANHLSISLSFTSFLEKNRQAVVDFRSLLTPKQSAVTNDFYLKPSL